MAKKSSSKMNKSTILVLVLMVIVGVVFGIGFYTYSQSLRKTIFVFSGDYKAGTQVTKDMFLTGEIDKDTYLAMSNNGHGGMYCTSEEISAYINQGDRLAVDVVAYMPVINNHFISSGGSGVESKLSDGMVAVEISAAKVSGLSGNEVGVGSRINVTSHYTMEGEDSVETKNSDLIFQDLLVLDVVNDEDGNISSIFVEVKPTEAVQLQHAMVWETISISVLKPGAYTPVEGVDNTAYGKVYYNPSDDDLLEGDEEVEGGLTQVDAQGNPIKKKAAKADTVETEEVTDEEVNEE